MTNGQNNQHTVRDEKAELLALQEQMFEQMARQNDIREREVIAIEKKTRADIELANVEKEKIQEMARKSNLEEQKIAVINHQIQEIRNMLARLEGFLNNQFPDHHKAIEYLVQVSSLLLEIQKIILPKLMHEGGDDEIERLTNIVKSITRPTDINFTTQIRGNAKNVSVSEKGNANIYNTD